MKVSDQIIEVLNYLCQKIGFTIDWTADNILPYVETLCEKLVKWEINTSIFWIILVSALALIMLIISVIVQKISYSDELKFFLWVVCVIIAFVTFIVIGLQIYDIITCYTFPEKFIYEYVQNLINSNTVR